MFDKEDFAIFFLQSKKSQKQKKITLVVDLHKISFF